MHCKKFLINAFNRNEIIRYQSSTQQTCLWILIPSHSFPWNRSLTSGRMVLCSKLEDEGGAGFNYQSHLSTKTFGIFRDFSETRINGLGFLRKTPTESIPPIAPGPCVTIGLNPTLKTEKQTAEISLLFSERIFPNFDILHSVRCIELPCTPDLNVFVKRSTNQRSLMDHH